MTISYFVEKCIAFLEISMGAFRNIGNLCDLTEGMFLSWMNTKALLCRLDIHSTVRMMYSGSYQKIEALFIMVVVME